MKIMTEKLNRRQIYSSNAFLSRSNIYCIYTASYRSRCFRCKFNSSCQYSFIKIYYNEDGNCIKCLRFTPQREPGETCDKDVGLYYSNVSHYDYNYFRAGRIL